MAEDVFSELIHVRIKQRLPLVRSHDFAKFIQGFSTERLRKEAMLERLYLASTVSIYIKPRYEWLKALAEQGGQSELRLIDFALTLNKELERVSADYARSLESMGRPFTTKKISEHDL